jgi:hypothetical protein
MTTNLLLKRGFWNISMAIYGMGGMGKTQEPSNMFTGSNSHINQAPDYSKGLGLVKVGAFVRGDLLLAR